jgi:hypothetical protein
MVEIRPHPRHSGQGVADRQGQRRLAGDARQSGVQPDFQIIEDRLCLRLPDLDAPVWRRSSGLLLNGVELRDAPDRLIGDRGSLGPMDVDELAPDMGHAGDLADLARPVKLVEPGIAVGMPPAAISCEMILRAPTLSIGREAIPAGGRGVAVRCGEGAPWVRRSLVAAIGPQPRRRGLAGAGRQYSQGSVAAKIACPADTCRPMASASGSSRAVDLNRPEFAGGSNS